VTDVSVDKQQDIVSEKERSMDCTRRVARTYSLVVLALALVTGAGHVRANTITRDASSADNQGNRIYTPLQVVTALTHHRHDWIGRVVRVALPQDTLTWGRGAYRARSAYQLSVELPADTHGVAEVFDVLVTDQQMGAARHVARAGHGHVPLMATTVLTVRLLGRDTPIDDLPLVADAADAGSARQLAPVAALCPPDL